MSELSHDLFRAVNADAQHHPKARPAETVIRRAARAAGIGEVFRPANF